MFEDDPFGLGLGYAPAGNLLTGEPLANIALEVASSADDAAQIIGGGSDGVVSITGTALGMQPDRLVGLRFLSVQAPNATVPTAAWLQIHSSLDIGGAGSAACVVTIYGEAADSAAIFTTAMSSLSSRAATTATVTWNLPESTGAAAWMAGSRWLNQKSPDISAILAEIFARPGWAPGQNVVLLLDHDGVGVGARQFAAWDHATLRPAKLFVRY